MRKKKVLVIVAHPDDETIWMGGVLIRNKKKWDITIISLCRKGDADRAPKFRKICKELGDRCFISDLDDHEQGDYIKITSQDIIKRVTRFAKREYDYVFTHGRNGEYGHIRHKETHKAINEMLKGKQLVAKRVFFFEYRKSNSKGQDYGLYNSSADILIKLSSKELALKKHLIQDLYGFQKNSFEEKSCAGTESFNKAK